MSSTTNVAAQRSPAANASFRNLPAVIFFPGDEAAQNAIAGLQRYLRMPFQDFVKGRESETILISSLERMIAEKAPMLRAPNVRVIAISNARYRDPRIDGVVYAYLPPNTPTGLVERAIDNAVDHIHLLATRRDVNEKLAGTTKEIHELFAAGAGLCAEHNVEKLLELALTQSREFAQADAGLLYIVEAQPSRPADPSLAKAGLRLAVAQNSSVAAALVGGVLEINDKTVPGYVALTGETVNIEDAYHLAEGVPFVIDRESDDDSGYRTKSVLAVAIRNLNGEILGVIQLINTKRDSGTKLTTVKAVAHEVIPFSVRMQEMIASLGLQAGVALENARLFQAISGH
jgi:GAF domain